MLNECKSFGRALEELLNSYSIENDSNTPDWILREYLLKCLSAYSTAVKDRDSFFKAGEK